MSDAQSLAVSGLIGSAISGLLIYAFSSFHQWSNGRREYSAAIQTVRFEMTTNVADLSVWMEGTLNEIQLRDDSYRSVQLTLNKRLPESLGQELARAYGTIGVMRGEMARIAESWHQGGLTNSPPPALRQTPALKSALQEWQRVSMVLESKRPNRLLDRVRTVLLGIGGVYSSDS